MNSRASSSKVSPPEVARIASELALAFDQLCIPSHDYAPVQATSFAGLDLRWYNRVTATLNGFGYRALGDMQKDVVVAAEYAPWFLRVVLSTDGTTPVLLSHIVLRHQLRLRNFFKTWVWDRGRHTILLSTEFSDGSFCETSTNPQLYDVAPGFMEQHLPATLSVHTVVLRHRQLITRYLRDKPDLKPLPLQGLQDVIASLNRAQARRAAERRARAAFSEAELWRLGHSPDLATALSAKMRQQNELVASKLT